jgi:D-tyrosyl-tRNA(Tyr) deacylase
LTYLYHMRALLQRVSRAHVLVDGVTVGAIEQGILVLLGIARSDNATDADYLASKIVELRIFDDAQGRMNLSVKDIQGALLIISQFTLYGDTRKGRRPSFDRAAKPEDARQLYDYFVNAVRKSDLPVETGVFQAAMSVHLENDGPVTILCDSVRLATDPC